ncbi:hypothetical protein B0H17DRAFT_1154179 [Mycena rosella]|uniref:Uncharacterized protein n=1 Tax=Mycena rosella TaxID=1033263 RepID=A0AAD7B039_MYCRO|nr:hypothetical protein B0H17DRAFT_1154179 [Mycena rosella]
MPLCPFPGIMNEDKGDYTLIIHTPRMLMRVQSPLSRSPLQMSTMSRGPHLHILHLILAHRRAQGGHTTTSPHTPALKRAQAGPSLAWGQQAILSAPRTNKCVAKPTPDAEMRRTRADAMLFQPRPLIPTPKRKDTLPGCRRGILRCPRIARECTARSMGRVYNTLTVSCASFVPGSISRGDIHMRTGRTDGCRCTDKHSEGVHPPSVKEEMVLDEKVQEGELSSGFIGW